MNSFLYDWNPCDLKAKFRIDYEMEPYEAATPNNPSTGGMPTNIDIVLLSVKVESEADGVILSLKQGTEFIPFLVSDQVVIFFQFYCGKYEIDIEAMCLADFESESDDDNQTQRKDDERDTD